MLFNFSLLLFALSPFCLPLPKRVPVTPSDIKAGHWAKKNTLRMVEMGIVPSHAGGKSFDGEKSASRTEIANALAKWAQTIQTGKWKTVSSVPVPASAIKTLDTGNWKAKPVTRYVLADTLAKAGDYLAQSLKPSRSGNLSDTGKSEALPPSPKVTLTKSHPAYVSLQYLASSRMIDAKSPLLNPNGATLTASEFSIALAHTAAGLTDRLTPLGHDEEGGTMDKTFHKKRP